MARRLPAEWEAHESTLLAWPGRSSVWGQHMERGRQETLEMVQAMANKEPVVVAYDPTRGDTQSKAFQNLQLVNNVTLVEIPLDDCWARDIAPIFVWDCDRARREAVDFRFNAWGGKFLPHKQDAAFGYAVSRYLEVDHVGVDLCLEGGSISVDGDGTAIIVEDTVVNSNRNRGTSKAEVEAQLWRALGIETVIWLPYGLTDDTDTDGHVDNVAIFCAPATVLVQGATSKSHPDAERMRVNQAVLRGARNARGRQLDLIDVPWLPASSLDSSRPCSYVNVCWVDNAVLIPVTGHATDRLALKELAEVFRPNEVIPILANALSYGGGGPHCMTMQIPRPQQQQEATTSQCEEKL